MAKTVTISLAEHEYMTNVIAHDGMTIARLEAELAQAKEDIKQMLFTSDSVRLCDFCKQNYATCRDCELQAEWRGWKEDD